MPQIINKSQFIKIIYYEIQKVQSAVQNAVKNIFQISEQAVIRTIIY